MTSNLDSLYSLYTGAVTSVPPLCDHKTGQVAVEGRKEGEQLPWSFRGGTKHVQTSTWTPWSPWSLKHVQNSYTKVAEEVSHSQVAQRRQGGGTCIVFVTEWMHSGGPLVALCMTCFLSLLSVLTIFLVAQRWHKGRSPESLIDVSVTQIYVLVRVG